MNSYDVLIIGSGLGGLQCAYILSKEGYKVAVLEKNHQIGGCLQSFTRKNTIFDTGMHYIGGMDKGQVLHRYFSYFGVNDRLSLKRLDENGYERISINGREYPFAMGYERFVETLLPFFPNEREALTRYTQTMKEISNAADVYNIRNYSGENESYYSFFSTSYWDYVCSLTQNQELREVLCGNAPLYAGNKNLTPLYVPMIINSTFIDSAYRFVEGGQQLANILADDIRQQGGEIITGTEVVKYNMSGEQISSVTTQQGEIYYARQFISNQHPTNMLMMIDSPKIKPAYRHRINSLENSYGVFSLYLALADKTVPYENCSYYHYENQSAWDIMDYTNTNWPCGYMLHFSAEHHASGYTKALTVNINMRWDELSQWENTSVEKRGADYKSFKEQKAEQVLRLLEKRYPDIRKQIIGMYTSTPLTYRDYTGTPNGSIYGVMKDYNNPLKTMISPKTKIPNLLLTGQNSNLHGVMGVTICSVLTCAKLLGINYLLNKISHAS